LKDKKSRIFGICSKCKKNIQIPSFLDPKRALCQDCFHDRTLKFKVKWDKIKDFKEIPDIWFFDSSITEILKETHNTKYRNNITRYKNTGKRRRKL
jgi:hypothetical protein